MDSLFGRSKKLTKPNRPSTAASELSERSVPYERAGAGRMPMQVGTVSQGLRAVGVISAPITNPTLTQDGTDLNIHSGIRLRTERETSQGDSSTVVSGDDQLRDGPTSPTTKKNSIAKSLGENSSKGGYFSGGRRKGDSDTAGSITPYSSRGNMGDFGAYSISPTSSSRTSNLPSSRSVATTSGASDHSFGVDATHVRYPSSILSTGADTVGSMASHIRDQLPEKVKESLHNLRQSYYGTVDALTSPGGDFNLPRPENPQEIEHMFERVRQERDIGDATNMTLEQKWGIVHAHELDRWKRDTQIRKSAAMGNGQPLIPKDTPEWYMKKFMDQTITAKHVGSLTVSLRTLPIESVHFRRAVMRKLLTYCFSWMHHFVALQGIQVVARALKNISMKGSLRYVVPFCAYSGFLPSAQTKRRC